MENYYRQLIYEWAFTPIISEVDLEVDNMVYDRFDDLSLNVGMLIEPWDFHIS